MTLQELKHMFICLFFVVLHILGYTLDIWLSSDKRSVIQPPAVLWSRVAAALYLSLTKQKSLDWVLFFFPHRCMKYYHMSTILPVQQAGTGNTGMPQRWHGCGPRLSSIALEEEKKKICVCVCKRIFFNVTFTAAPIRVFLQAVSVLALKCCNCTHWRLDWTRFKCGVSPRLARVICET